MMELESILQGNEKHCCLTGESGQGVWNPMAGRRQSLSCSRAHAITRTCCRSGRGRSTVVRLSKVEGDHGDHACTSRKYSCPPVTLLQPRLGRRAASSTSWQAQHMQARQNEACRSSLTISGNWCRMLWPMHLLPLVVRALCSSSYSSRDSQNWLTP